MLMLHLRSVHILLILGADLRFKSNFRNIYTDSLIYYTYYMLILRFG